jgi:hypothetical protein
VKFKKPVSHAPDPGLNIRPKSRISGFHAQHVSTAKALTVWLILTTGIGHRNFVQSRLTIDITALRVWVPKHFRPVKLIGRSLLLFLLFFLGGAEAALMIGIPASFSGVPLEAGFSNRR